jgi:hypothetical protein
MNERRRHLCKRRGDRDTGRRIPSEVRHVLGRIPEHLR